MRPYLYIFVNETLSSMTSPGKFAAHAAHAANLFDYNIKNITEGYNSDSMAEYPLGNLYTKWIEEGNGFGTTVVVDVRTGPAIFTSGNKVIEDILHDSLMSVHFDAGVVTDPTYPFFAPYEFIKLMDNVSYDRSKEYVDNDIVHATRREVTAAYVFVDKDNDANNARVAFILKTMRLYSLR